MCFSHVPVFFGGTYAEARVSRSRVTSSEWHGLWREDPWDGSYEVNFHYVGDRAVELRRLRIEESRLCPFIAYAWAPDVNGRYTILQALLFRLGPLWCVD